MDTVEGIKGDSLHGNNPYTLMKNFLSQEIIDLFDIKEIDQKDIILNDTLFNY